MELEEYVKKCGEAANRKGWKVTWETLPAYLMATVGELSEAFENGWRGGSKESLLYIAGFFDGEGCISFSKKNTSYNVHINITNTNKKILDWIQKVLKERGIETKLYARKKEKETWKQCYRLECFKLEDVKKFLGLIFPYLKVKRRQALLVLEFIMLRQKARKENYHAKLSTREQEIVQEVHRMNSTETIEELDEKSDEERFNEEIGDCLIRLFHICHDLGIDIESILKRLMSENEKRPYLHGHKRI